MKIVAISALGLLIAAPAYADFVTLKDGERIEGVVTEEGDQVVVRLDFGTITIEKAEVSSIEKAPSLLGDFEARRAKIGSRDVDGLYRLGLEAEKSGLSAQARGLFREVIELSPDHKGARAALGYRQHEGQWMTEEEFMTSRGYVRYNGHWVTADAAQALEAAEIAKRQARAAERAAEDQQRLARLEREVADARATAEAARAEASEAVTATYGLSPWYFVPVYGANGFEVQKVRVSGNSFSVQGQAGAAPRPGPGRPHNVRVPGKPSHLRRPR